MAEKKTVMRKKEAGNKIPPALAERLTGQLGEEGFAAFMACQEAEPRGGLRINPLKGRPGEIAALLPFELEPVPWAQGGYYYPAAARPAKLPYYQAGLYYLQEPSAMSAAAMLNVAPGDRVLDLCAAPGGKTTQLAGSLQGRGLLVANDNNAKRIKALVWNLEHWGVTDYLVLNEEPARLTGAFREFFNRVLVDAPCSGEGMFRKDPKALKGWQAFNGQVCRNLQEGILAAAAGMLMPGGRLLYSTCTFNPLENEDAVAGFLAEHGEFRTVALPVYEGWQPGRRLADARQLWPHLVKGEGHFLCLLEKAGQDRLRTAAETTPAAPGLTGDHAAAPAAPKEGGGEAGSSMAPFFGFMAENFTSPLAGPFRVFDRHVYRINPELPDLSGLKVARAGWYLGMLKDNRFEPSQPMAMGISGSRMRRRLDLDPGDQLVERYLRGETLMVEGEPGWTLVTLGGYPLGFGKQTGDYLKNAYSPAWRRSE